MMEQDPAGDPASTGAGPRLDVEIGRQGGGWRTQEEDSVRRAARAAFAAALDFPETPRADLLRRLAAIELSILLADDAFIRTLNDRFRGKNRPTNVLSFPVPPAPAGVPEHTLGDIVLGFETLEREAAAQEKSFDAHLVHLVVHGLLHLLDYDHQSPAQAALMEGYEKRILAGLGLDDPYAPGAGASSRQETPA